MHRGPKRGRGLWDGGHVAVIRTRAHRDREMHEGTIRHLTSSGWGRGAKCERAAGGWLVLDTVTPDNRG